jgi:hypothetical protein
MSERADLAARPAARVTEKMLHEAIVALATLLGWSHFHAYEMRRSDAGWPDLVLVRGGRLLAWELKSATGKLSPAQEEWLGILGGVPCVETAVIRPDDWLGGDVERWLR